MSEINLKPSVDISFCLFLGKNAARSYAYVNYFNDLSLIENLKAIGEIILKDDRERLEKIHYLISKFALDNVQEVKAKHLSGGQRRKLVICMALLGDPKILLCDEIFAALDVLTIHMLKEILVKLQNEKLRNLLIFRL